MAKSYYCDKCSIVLASIKDNTTIIPNNTLNLIQEVKDIDGDVCRMVIKCKCGEIKTIIV
jgi:hypothetical protein